MNSRFYPAHLLFLFGVILLVQSPRAGGRAGALADPLALRLDFADLEHAYYPAALEIQDDPAALYRRPGEIGPASRPAPFVNIPLLAWLYVPLTAVSLRAAGLIILGLNTVAILACLLLLQRRIAAQSRWERWGVTLMFASSGPIVHALNLGQNTPLTLLLLLLGERSTRRGREIPAGLMLGLVCLIKVPPLLLLPYLLLRRRWRIVAAAVAVLLTAYAASVALYGWPLHVEHFDTTFRTTSGTDLAAHYNQSFDGALTRILTDADMTSRKPVVLPDAGRTALAASIAVVVLLTLRSFRGRAPQADPAPLAGDERFLLESGAVLCLSLLISPLSWVHYGMWLIPVAAIVGGRTMRMRSAGAHRPAIIALLIVSVVLINIPIPPIWIVRRFDQELWFRLAISHQCLGTLLLLALCWHLLRGGCDRGEERRKALPDC